MSNDIVLYNPRDYCIIRENNRKIVESGKPYHTRWIWCEFVKGMICILPQLILELNSMQYSFSNEMHMTDFDIDLSYFDDLPAKFPPFYTGGYSLWNN